MLGHLLQLDLEELIQEKNWDELRKAIVGLTDQDLAELAIDLPAEDEGVIFRLLPRDRSASVFSYLPVEKQEELIQSLTTDQTRDIFAAMTPDDRVRLLDELPAEVTRRLLDVLPPKELAATRALLNYPPGTAGHLMTPNYVALRSEMTVEQALEHIRRSPKTTETLNIVYVVDSSGKLIEDLRLATVIRAEPGTVVGSLQDSPVVTIPVRATESEVVKSFEHYDRTALPVVDADGKMLGIITVDDVLDVARKEATEDMQKLGGMEAIDTPYTQTPFLTLLKKRGGWLSVLFLGEMLTASAMAHFQIEIEKAVVLALFIPLIISSGGNSGSQATTLIIRALALTELKLSDWWHVARRELASGLLLGTWLGFIGFLRVYLWQHIGWFDYGPHYLLIGVTVWLSLIGVMTFGTIVGSMLPFMLRAVKLDPATSSAPFVATLVDVTGLVIYFSVAALILRGTLL
ncbi:MAG: magnesium transporter [Planctomycetes bacterium]|nr:magnesium transporter [Planctomycetota bacterium]